MTSWTLVITGAPRTKKTSNVLATAGRRRVVLPSLAWRRWTREAGISLFRPTPCERFPDSETEYLFAGIHPLTDRPVGCRALFYRDADRGDLVGYLQGLADLLEQRGVLANDRQIASWDGSRLRKDAVRPRVELVIEELPIVAPTSARP